MAPRKEQGQQQQGWYPRPFFSYLSKAEALEDIAAIQSSTRRESRMPARYGGSHAAPSNAPRKTDLESFTAAGQPSHPPSQQWQSHTTVVAAPDAAVVPDVLQMCLLYSWVHQKRSSSLQHHNSNLPPVVLMMKSYLLLPAPQPLQPPPHQPPLPGWEAAGAVEGGLAAGPEQEGEYALLLLPGLCGGLQEVHPPGALQPAVSQGSHHGPHC
ncbi:hypothetical protein QJQ45_014315 [Haematococcus lacustris]|nr:hypothetical protein QJQ45_014315 [Haematococcus lacustris]